MANQDKLTQKDWDLIQVFMDNTVRDNKQKLSSTVVYEKLHKKLSTSLSSTEFQPMLSIAVRAGTIKGYKGVKGRYGGYMRLSAITPVVDLPETEEVQEAKPVEQEAPKTEPEPEEPKPTQPEEDPVDPEGDTDPAPAQTKPAYSSYSTPVPTTVEGINKAAKEREEFLATKATHTTTRPANGAPRTDIPHQAWKRVQRLKVMVEDRQYQVPMAACDIRQLITVVLQGETDEHGPIEVDGECYSCSDLKLLERFLQCFFESTLVLFSTDHPEYVAPYSNEASPGPYSNEASPAPYSNEAGPLVHTTAETIQ